MHYFLQLHKQQPQITHLTTLACIWEVKSTLTLQRLLVSFSLGYRFISFTFSKGSIEKWKKWKNKKGNFVTKTKQKGKKWETFVISLLGFQGLWNWIPGLGKKRFRCKKKSLFQAVREVTFQITSVAKLSSKGNLPLMFHLYFFFTLTYA